MWKRYDIFTSCCCINTKNSKSTFALSISNWAFECVATGVVGRTPLLGIYTVGRIHRHWQYDPEVKGEREERELKAPKVHSFELGPSGWLRWTMTFRNWVRPTSLGGQIHILLWLENRYMHRLARLTECYSTWMKRSNEVWGEEDVEDAAHLKDSWWEESVQIWGDSSALLSWKPHTSPPAWGPLFRHCCTAHRDRCARQRACNKFCHSIS